MNKRHDREVHHMPLRYRFFYLKDIYITNSLYSSLHSSHKHISIVFSKQWMQDSSSFMATLLFSKTQRYCVCFYSFQHIHHSSQEVQKALVLNVRLQNTNAIITEIIERFLAHLDPLQLWNLLFSCLMILSQIGEYFSPMPWWKPQVITIKLFFSLCWVSALTVVVLLLLSLSFTPSL